MFHRWCKRRMWLQISLKRCGYTSLFWPDEQAHAFAFLFKPQWSRSLYFECHSTSIPLFKGSCSFSRIMIGIGYNLMQCYTIFILSRAMLSLITSYSLGKNPTQLQSHIMSQRWCQVLPGIWLFKILSPPSGCSLKGWQFLTLMNEVECTFHSSSKEMLWFSKSVFYCLFLCLIGDGVHSYIIMATTQYAKYFLVTFSFCVWFKCVFHQRIPEKVLYLPFKKYIYRYATSYVKCISSILSAARVTLVFFGFFPPYFWPTLIYYVPFTLGHLWQLQKLAEKFSKKEPSKKNDRELCLGKAALFSKSGSLKPSQTWVSFHF